MERPQSSVPPRPVKKFKPNSFNVESFLANFHRNPAKSIQIIPKLSKQDLNKFIEFNGLKLLANSLQKNKNEKEILSLLHHKKIPFDVNTFGKSGLGECVFKIGKKKSHPLFERAAALLKRWKRAAKRSGSRSPRENSPENEKQKQNQPPPKKVPEKPRSRKINFVNVPKRVMYDPEDTVLAFRTIADYTAPPTEWVLPPRIWMNYKIPKSEALEEELRRCKGPECTKIKDSPDEKFELRSVIPSPIEIDCRDVPAPSIPVELFPEEKKVTSMPRAAEEDHYYRDAPRRDARQPSRKRKFREQHRRDSNHKKGKGSGGRRDNKRRRFETSPKGYQESHRRLKSKTNTKQIMVI